MHSLNICGAKQRNCKEFKCLYKINKLYKRLYNIYEYIMLLRGSSRKVTCVL